MNEASNKRCRRLLFVLAVGLIGLLIRNGAATADGTLIVAPDTQGSVGEDTSLALDIAGNPVVSYHDSTNLDLKLLHCNEAKCAGGDDSITTPDHEGSVGTDTSLALDASGFPVVSYYDAGARDLKLLHCNDPDCAGGDDSITRPDSADFVGLYTSLELDAAGNPVVSYHDAGAQNLKLLHCNDPNCAGDDESITVPDSTGVVGLYTSLELDASGNPVVSHSDSGNGDLRVLHCNDPNCAGHDDSVTVPDSEGLVGAFSSLALDSSGYPVVSYRDATYGALKLVHCNDANCAGGDDSVVTADRADLARYTSLVLDAGGRPVVSYYDLTHQDLKVLHCGGPNCLGPNEPVTTPDSDGDVGTFTSLALDGAGNPVVSYADVTNSDLKLLHCRDASCASADPVTPRPSATQPATPTRTPTPALASGDVNCSSTVDSIDAALILQLGAGLLSSLSCGQNADVTGDGHTNAVDAALVLQYVAGLLHSLPP